MKRNDPNWNESSTSNQNVNTIRRRSCNFLTGKTWQNRKLYRANLVKAHEDALIVLAESAICYIVEEYEPSYRWKQSERENNVLEVRSEMQKQARLIYSSEQMPKWCA